MKLIRTADGKAKLKISKDEWETIGKDNGWNEIGIVEAKKKKEKKEKKWIQKAVPEKNEGKFAEWCKRNGFKGVCQSCINKAISKGGSSAKMANFAINVSKGKYKHPDKKKK